MIYCAKCEELLEACSCPPNPLSLRQVGDTPRITALRLIVSRHQAMKIEGTLVDGSSAQLYLAIWGGANRANKMKLERMALGRAMQICWQIQGLGRSG